MHLTSHPSAERETLEHVTSTDGTPIRTTPETTKEDHDGHHNPHGARRPDP
jgi:hypothetical protein